MTTIADIPKCTAVHLPTPTAPPVTLAEGELSLTILPADPPNRPSQVLTLTVGAMSWPMLPSAPVRKVQAKKEHASYAFNPAPADGSKSLGQVRLIMKDSRSQGEWEATEALCAKFEEALKSHKVWDEQILFVNDEYELAGENQKGWGETVAAAVVGAGHAAAEKLNLLTDRHTALTDPQHPPPPSQVVSDRAQAANEATARLAEKAEQTATTIGMKTHVGGKVVGAQLPDSIARAAKPVPEDEKSGLQRGAEATWEQAKIAAGGIATAAGTVAGSVSENAHKAVEHNYGKEADAVAQDVGQAGANIGQTGMAATKATIVFVQGANAAQGAAATKFA